MSKNSGATDVNYSEKPEMPDPGQENGTPGETAKTVNKEDTEDIAETNSSEKESEHPREPAETPKQDPPEENERLSPNDMEKDRHIWEDEEDEEDAEEKPSHKGHWALKFLVGAVCVIGILVAAYLGISLFFTSHFYMNTTINGEDFSGKTPADVEAYISEQIQSYTLTILQKEGKSDVIRAEDIGLTYQKTKEIDQILENQKAFLWPKALFEETSQEVSTPVTYDGEALRAQLQNIQAFQVERVEPVSAYPRYDGEKYVIEPEVTGTDVNVELLNTKAAQCVLKFEPELDMEAEKCYIFPRYTSQSPEVQAACDELNRYLQASITYTMDENVVVDKELISSCLSVDENLVVSFQEEPIRAWLEAFGDRYDTVGTTRTITTPTGKTVEVSGGTYGWGIDEETELSALINSIKNGEVITKEPAYYPGQTAASHGPQDWGNTYAEVDLSAQHMWFISNGQVAMESDVVTGVPIPAKETTPGVFDILEKALKATLVGNIIPSTGQPEYRTPVDFWMRITWSGIGFHDATWQPAFGGNRYSIGYGSHGCVNMPYDKASELYDLISVGTPVIIHY